MRLVRLPRKRVSEVIAAPKLSLKCSIYGDRPHTPCAGTLDDGSGDYCEHDCHGVPSPATALHDRLSELIPVYAMIIVFVSNLVAAVTFWDSERKVAGGLLGIEDLLILHGVIGIGCIVYAAAWVMNRRLIRIVKSHLTKDELTEQYEIMCLDEEGELVLGPMSLYSLALVVKYGGGSIGQRYDNHPELRNVQVILRKKVNVWEPS